MALENQRKFIEYQSDILENTRNFLKTQQEFQNKLITLLGLSNYSSNIQSNSFEEKTKSLLAFHMITNVKIYYDFSKSALKLALDVFKLLTPMNIENKKKVRLGGDFDGGYVTIAPEIIKENNGIAYSFGVSNYDPWSLEMVKRGYNVYQYDGTIENSPYTHPMIHFYKYLISSSTDPKPNEKNIKRIFEDHGHYGKNIFLNIDIEGAEWDFFESLAKEEISCFEQIIVEFHEFLIDDKIQRKIEILKKINETHQSIHVHANNGAWPLATILLGFRQLPAVMEVTYIRKNPEYKFTACMDEFPGKFDSPNDQLFPDIYLGFFNEQK